jgi:dCTP deaminase
MAVWSDTDILLAVRDKRFSVLPWHEADLTPNGLDLRIGSVLVPGSMQAAATSGTVTVPPASRFVVGTEAVLSMPSDAVGSLWLRSSWARRGVLASFGKVDAGFAGNLTLGCFHAGHEPLLLPVGERFCQLVVEDLKSPAAKAYETRSGNYQGQRGVTLGPKGGS